MQRSKLTKKMAMVAMFAAMSYVITVIAHYLHLTIVPSVPFLTYDPKDIIICIAGFILGPIPVIGVSVAVSFLEMITISQTGFYGFIMNIISTCAFVLPAALIYRSKKSFKGALLSLLTGFISVIIVMTLWNIIITPIYMGIERSLLINQFLIYIVIFNIVKTAVNVALVLLLYKPIVSALRLTKLVESNKSMDKKTTLTMLIIGGVLLIVAIITWILLKTLG